MTNSVNYNARPYFVLKIVKYDFGDLFLLPLRRKRISVFIEKNFIIKL